MNGISTPQINGNDDSGSPDYTTIKLNCNLGGLNIGALGAWFVYPPRSLGGDGYPTAPGIFLDTDSGYVYLYQNGSWGTINIS